MSGASIETTLKLGAGSLRDIKARMRPLFTQERVAASAGLFLDGLLGDGRRKIGWMRAEAAGDPGPWRQQAILGRGRWDADALRDLVRDYVVETLTADDAVLVIDETGFLKQGRGSCGVGRQYTGSAGKITNCQIGVFAALVSWHGHAFIDVHFICPRPERTTARGWRRPMCRRRRVSRPSPGLPSARSNARLRQVFPSRVNRRGKGALTHSRCRPGYAGTMRRARSRSRRARALERLEPL